MRRVAALVFGLALAAPCAAAPPATIIPTTGPTGAPGTGIASMSINSAGHLIVQLTDGSTQDAGSISPIPAIVATPGAVASAVVPMPQAAATGWACSVNDLTTTSPQVAIVKETATTTTSVTVSAFTDVLSPSAFGASDVIQLNCRPY